MRCSTGFNVLQKKVDEMAMQDAAVFLLKLGGRICMLGHLPLIVDAKLPHRSVLLRIDSMWPEAREIAEEFFGFAVRWKCIPLF